MDQVVEYVSRQLATKSLPLTTTSGIFDHTPTLGSELNLFWVQATIIMSMCRALSLCGAYLRQPAVIFEIVGGILLGPSCIGEHGHNIKYLDNIFPTSSLNYLGLIAQIGLTFYLFLVGIELDSKALVTHARKAGGIAILGMAVPFALGIAISKVMFRVLQSNDPNSKYANVSFTSFFVFIGTAMSITAFPVLARILKFGGLIYTKPGSMAMSAAALNDAIAWCLLTLAISIANAGDMRVAGYIFGTMIAFALVLFVIIRPIYDTLVTYVEAQHDETMQNHLFALTIGLVFMSAWFTGESFTFLSFNALF